MRARIGWLLVFSACGPASQPAYLVYVRDRQGSVVAAVDDRGQKVWESHQDSYGLRLASAGVPVPRGFLDQPLDEETGFYHFRYRDYDPATAQWLSPEPALLERLDRCSEKPQLCKTYAYESVGITGPNSTQAFLSLVVGKDLIDPASHLHIILQVQIYPNLASMPSSLTRVVANFSDPKARSSYEPGSSTINLRGDAATSTREVFAHEIGHSLGVGDHYLELFGHTFNQPGAKNDLMANFWESRTPQFNRDDVFGILRPDEPRNQGLEAPTNSSEWVFSVPPTDALTSPPWLGGLQ